MSATNKSAAKGCGMIVIAVVGAVLLFAVLSALIGIVFDIDPNSKPKIETTKSRPAAAKDLVAAPDDREFKTRTPKPGEIQSLAEETLLLIEKSDQTFGYAIQASDGQAIRDDVEMPAWNMLMRWHQFSYDDYSAYEACYDVLLAMHGYADKLTDVDSADRRRSLDYETKRLEKYVPKCKKKVDSKGRIRSNE